MTLSIAGASLKETNTPVFLGTQTSLPNEGNLWVQARKTGSSVTIAQGFKKNGLSVIEADLSNLSGEDISLLAFGIHGSNQLHYVNGLTYKLGEPINFSAAIGPTLEFTPTQISGVVEVDGEPIAGRTVRAFSYYDVQYGLEGATVNLSRSLGSATSDENGNYTIALEKGFDAPCFVVAFDDYGVAFTPDTAVAEGDRIRPSTFSGYVYDVTSAGTLPAQEPNWPSDENQTFLAGSATLQPRAFYRPVAHGPVQPTPG